MAQRQWRSDDTDPWKEAFGNAAIDVIKTTNETASPANATCIGTASTKALSLGAASTFANNDIVLIHQTQKATGAGVWELNRIVSGAGTTSLTMKYDLMNTYVANAQIVGAIMAKNYTINTGVTVTLPAWDGAKGGIYFVIAKNAISVVGTIQASGKGFRGPGGGSQGESELGAGASNNQGANGMGGGAALYNSSPGGGGHATAGQAGTSGGGETYVGAGGGTFGNASLTIMDFGGAGGGNGDAGGNGHGGGAVVLIGKTITVTGSILANGTVASTAAGAGGSTLYKGEVINLGSGLVAANGAIGATYARKCGDGGNGRNHADYSKTLSGTTSPSLDYTLDVTIKAGGGAPRVVNFN